MLNVYNYYMQDYVSRSPRYSVHKKRELHDIYKNIVKLSASEPLYKVELSESKQACALSIKESAIALKDVSQKLQNTPLLHTAGIHSSAPDVVKASLLHRMDLSDFKDHALYEIEVKSLASGQRNLGTLLPSKEAPLHEGSYSFTISFDREQYAFRFNVAAEAPAFELQSKLADFINKSGIGLNAQVSYHREPDISRMELTAKQTGVLGKSSFLLTDTAKPEGADAGLVETFGLNQLYAPAQNAQFSINGTSHTSLENTVSCDDTLQLTFLATTTEPVTVRPVADRTVVYDALEEFVVSYNSLVHSGKAAIQENKSSAFLLRGLSHLVASHYSSLTSAGIISGEDGYLALDSEALEKAVVSGSIDAAFQMDSSFFKALEIRLETAILNPMRYVDKKLVAYPNPGAPLSERTSPYTTSIYSGMLFNNYC